MQRWIQFPRNLLISLPLEQTILHQVGLKNERNETHVGIIWVNRRNERDFEPIEHGRESQIKIS